jgi:hypothetical protein
VFNPLINHRLSFFVFLQKITGRLWLVASDKSGKLDFFDDNLFCGFWNMTECISENIRIGSFYWKFSGILPWSLCPQERRIQARCRYVVKVIEKFIRKGTHFQ